MKSAFNPCPFCHNRTGTVKFCGSSNYIIVLFFSFSLGNFKMESTEVLTPESSTDKSSRFYVLSWINNLLKTNFQNVREMGSGDASAFPHDST